jgi:hypothetical protein
MHEREIFKHIEKSPKYLKTDDISRVLTKVWSAYTKLLRSLLSSYKTATTQEFGKFIPTAQGAQFSPSQFFLSLGNYSPKPVPTSSQSIEAALSYSSISLASGYDRETCISSIKEILSAAVFLSKSGKVTLDMKIGQLHLQGNDYSFANNFKPQSSQTEKQETKNPANPNDIGLINNSEKRFKSVPPNPSNIPFPYLPAFYDDSSKKLGKRFNFEDQPSPSQLLEEHKKQIAVKKYKTLAHSKETKREGQILATIANQQMIEERQSKEQKEKTLQNLFVSANRSQIDSHLHKKQELVSEKKTEKYDFFPFIYGSKLEEFQQQLKSQLNDEMKKKMENDRKEFSSKKEITDSYLTSFPVFLKQDKFEPKRRVENLHVKATMGQALNRYEQELQQIKDQRVQDSQKEEAQTRLNKLYEEQNKIHKETNALDNKNYLLQQMEDKVKKK